jgi:hypothetical protein
MYHIHRTALKLEALIHGFLRMKAS